MVVKLGIKSFVSFKCIQTIGKVQALGALPAVAALKRFSDATFLCSAIRCEMTKSDPFTFCVNHYNKILTNQELNKINLFSNQIIIKMLLITLEIKFLKKPQPGHPLMTRGVNTRMKLVSPPLLKDHP